MLTYFIKHDPAAHQTKPDHIHITAPHGSANFTAAKLTPLQIQKTPFF
jgi:hypothetical protein